MTRTLIRRILVVLALAAGAAPLQAAPLAHLEVSPDTAVSFGSELLGPEEVGQDDLSGNIVFTGADVLIPVGADLEAFERPASSRLTLLSTDITLRFANGVTAGPGDLVRVIDGIPSILFSGLSHGLARGVRIDAATQANDGDLLLSFDVTATLGTVTASDEDLVRLDSGTRAVSLAFDGSTHGIASGLDLDAADIQPDGDLLLSFDGSGSVASVSFADEDVVRYAASGSFALAYDGSAESPAWQQADLDAIEATSDDGDAIADGRDNCPFAYNPGQADRDRNGRGDDCECGDQNRDGRVNVSDIVAINSALFVASSDRTLCDGNNDLECDVSDIVSVNAEIFSIGTTSTCLRQPVPGPSSIN